MSLTRQNDSVMSEEVRAEAATWIARLRDEQRGPDVETDLRNWLGESDEHRRAFNRMTRVWELAGNIRMRARADVSGVRAGRSRFSPWAAALAALGIPAFACTPDAFPELLALAIEGGDIESWAHRNAQAAR